jgi:putative hydrolase of the HAD superfamily
LITDADNTLWDTNAVFAAAHLHLLKRIEEAHGRSLRRRDRLAAVRELDEGLALALGGRLDYSPRLLVEALSLRVRDECESARAVRRALALRESRASSQAVGAALRAFRADLRTTPALRPGVRRGLGVLRRREVRVMVATEGSASRCRRLIRELRLGDIPVVAAAKSRSLFERMAATAKPTGGVRFMVGDQLDRDIEASRLAGYVTVHFPGGFQPVWTRGRAVAADFTIKSFAEVPEIVRAVLARESKGVDV